MLADGPWCPRSGGVGRSRPLLGARVGGEAEGAVPTAQGARSPFDGFLGPLAVPSSPHSPRMPVVAPVRAASSTRRWAGIAAEVRAQGTETAAGIEALLQELAGAVAGLEAEFEAKRQQVCQLDERCEAESACASKVDQQVSTVQQARIGALDKVQGLTRAHANEMKAVKHQPPPAVRHATQAVYTVLRCERWKDSDVENMRRIDYAKEWNTIQRKLCNDDFVQSVLSFDSATLEAAPHVAEFVAERYFPTLRRMPLPAVEPALMAAEIETVAGKPNQRAEACGGGDLPAEQMVAAVGELHRSFVDTKHRSIPAKPLAARPADSGFRTQTGLGQRGASARLLPSVGAVSPRSGAAASLAASRLIRGSSGSASYKSSSAEGTGAQPLDLEAVAYANHACGALTQWLCEVLREFFALRELRRLQEAARARVEAAVAERRRSQEVCASLQEELQELAAESEDWRARLAELRAREREAELARANLSKLSRLEDLYGGGGDLQPAAPSPPALLRTGRRGLLPGTAVPKAPPRSARSASLAQLPCAAAPRRKYLHIMSTPALPAPDEEASIDRGTPSPRPVAT